MLLIDGVRYELWTPPSEDEFEQVAKEHTQEIFGEQSIYIDRKQKLKSLSGIGSIPDGYVIILGTVPQWHIVEAELSSHPLDQHIVAQVSRFITGIKNPNTQRDIVGAMYNEVTKNGYLKLKVEEACKVALAYYQASLEPKGRGARIVLLENLSDSQFVGLESDSTDRMSKEFDILQNQGRLRKD